MHQPKDIDWLAGWKSEMHALPLTTSLCLTLLPAASAAKLLQLCLTLSDPIDGRPPGSSVPGILQVRILEWVAIPFSTLHPNCT